MGETNNIELSNPPAIPLDNLDFNVSVPLSVPLLALYLKRGAKQSEIARICNISPQAVSDYIQRHSDELGPLVEKDDSLMAMEHKHVALQAARKLSIGINNLEDRECKKYLVPLNMISGTHIDKYRLLSGQSTANIDVHTTILQQSEESERARRAQHIVSEGDNNAS